MEPQLPRTSSREIDEICKRYEDQWLNGEQPSLEEFAIHEDSRFARQLFSDLLDLYLHYCQSKQLAPDFQQLQANLPRFEEQLSKKLRELNAAESDTFDDSIQDTLPAAGQPTDRQVDNQPKLLRYEILNTLGRGAMGVVYLAKDKKLGRKVALKTPLLTEDTALSVQRFFREARAAAALHHRNICPVYDVGQERDTAFLTMAYVQGESLSEMIKSGKGFSAVETANMIRKIALALHSAHKQGVVHRDLKPSNIMLDHESEPVVMDFGLARQTQIDDATQLTHSGVILGTPAYMSPEQLHDCASAGPSADIFSLGVVMYQVMTGDLPFKGSIMSLLTKILSAEPLQPSQIKPGLDPRLERLCLKAMAKEPADRFSTMQEFADALKTVQDSVPARELQTKHDSPRHMAPKPSKSKSKERFNGDVDRHRFKSLAKIIGSAIGFAAMLYGVIVFLPTPKGMIRVEVLEPKLEVVVNSTGATIQGEGTEALQLKPGIQSFRIMHGEFEFQTDSFVLRKGDEIQVKIEWIEGALVAKKDGQLLESRLLKSPQPQPNVREQPRQANVNQPKASTESLTQKQALDIDMLLEQMRESGAEIAVNHELLPPAKWSSITVEACNVYLSPEFALTKYEMGLLLARLPGLYSLTICGNLFEPEAIGLVRGSGICKLSVEHCHGRPPGTIDQLTQLDTIKELHLYDCEIEDADLVRICGLKQLKTLQIGANEITSEGVRALKQLENLEVLFGSVPTEDPKAAAHLLSTLQSCKKLRHLVMSALPASDLSALGQLRSLRRLDLYSMGKPILDLSPVIETEIQMIELDSYNATLHHDVILRAENLETINRIPKEEFLKTHAGSILQDD